MARPKAAAATPAADPQAAAAAPDQPRSEDVSVVSKDWTVADEAKLPVRQTESLVNIRVNLLDEDPENPRTTKPSQEQEDGFRLSLKLQGILQPLLVRPQGDRFLVVAGARRLRNAIALGWEQVPCMLFHGTAAEAAAAQAAENAQRLALPVIDEWIAFTTLQRRGVSFADLCNIYGLTERRARQFERLGQSSPAMIELFKARGVPPDNILAQIARASPERQAAVLRSGAVKKMLAGQAPFGWFVIADLFRDSSIPRSYAIFDPEKESVAFQLDVFAEPGSPAEWTTVDVQGFVAAQRRALAELVADEVRARIPARIVEWNVRDSIPSIPDGYLRCFDEPRGKGVLPKTDPRIKLLALDTSNQMGRVVSMWVVKKASAKKAPKKASPAKAAARQADPSDSAGQPGDDQIDTPPADDGEPMTVAGRLMVSVAKTRAIQDRLAQDGESLQTETLLRLLCLAVTGSNVKVSGYDQHWAPARGIDAVAKALVTADGKLDPRSPIKKIAAELLAIMVQVDKPNGGAGSGPVAETIGFALSADEKMGRFDTAEFLATLKLPALVALRDECDLPNVKTATQIRAVAVGKCPVWLPKTAVFTPVPRAELTRLHDWENDEGDDGES